MFVAVELFQKKFIRVTTIFLWRCTSKNCTKTFSIRVGTFFDKSKLSIEKIFKIIYCWVIELSQLQCSHETGVSQHSLVDWYNFCRDICFDKLSDIHFDSIGGPGVVVEIDESKFGKRKYNTGKRVDGVWVFGGIERDNKKNCFFVVVNKRDSRTLLPLIRRYIKPGSTIVSDCWKAYDRIPRLGLNYTHKKVNHRIEYVNEEGFHTNTIESTWHRLKAFKKTMSKKLIDTYFCEFIFRRHFFTDIDANLRFSAFLKFITETYCKEKADEKLREKRLTQ